MVRYGSNQSLCVASRGLRHNLDQNKPMYTCVRPHCNFKQLWRSEKRSHNPHDSKYMISLAGNSKAIENLLTLWLKFLANCFLQSLDDNLGVPRSRLRRTSIGGRPPIAGRTPNGSCPRPGNIHVYEILQANWNVYQMLQANRRSRIQVPFSVVVCWYHVGLRILHSLSYCLNDQWYVLNFNHRGKQCTFHWLISSDVA